MGGESGFLHDADLGCTQDSVFDLPASLHHNGDCVVFLFAFGHGENSFVEFGVELLSLWVILYYFEAAETAVHYIGSHSLALNIRLKKVFQCLSIFFCHDLVHVSVLERHSDSVSNF